MKKIKGFFQKCGAWIKKSADKVAMCACMPFMSLSATEGTGADVSGMLDSIKGLFSDFSVDNLILIIGAALSLGVVLFLFWFAYRFVKRAVVKALKKGSI